MQRCYAVDGVAAHASEVCHAHVARSALIDQRHARNTLVVAEETQPHLVQKARVDFEHDLKVPRQDLAEYGQ